MPVLKNPKHELFAQKVAKGASESSAYAEVYEKDATRPTTRGMASTLRSKPIVSQRIAELQAAGAEEAITSIADVLRDLVEMKTRGMKLEPRVSAFGQIVPGMEVTHDAKTAMKALELLGKYHGMFKEKVEVEVTGQLALRLQKARERRRS
jgi:hypothetical protein